MHCLSHVTSTNFHSEEKQLPTYRRYETFSKQHREQLAVGYGDTSTGPKVSRTHTRITVVVRKRPLTSQEVSRNEEDIVTMIGDKSTIRICEPRKNVFGLPYVEPHDFAFDRAYSDTDSNYQVYNSCVRKLVSSVFEEKARCSCFAYGQTGSGKTYTMVGPGRAGFKAKTIETQGLVELAGRDIFRWLERPEFQRHANLYVNFFEIYCNRIYDLLKQRQLVKALETKTSDGVVVKNLTSVRCPDLDSLLKQIMAGLDQRIVGSNSKNVDSSRGHAILTLEIRNEHIGQVIGKLAFIDLAGSERGADAMLAGKVTQVDGAGINRSLLALKECIRALDQQSTHVPFRDSELTKVLRDMFIGDKTKTLMISCISPSATCCEQSLNTLRYADRVKAIRRYCKPDLDDSKNSGDDDNFFRQYQNAPVGTILESAPQFKNDNGFMLDKSTVPPNSECLQRSENIQSKAEQENNGNETQSLDSSDYSYEKETFQRFNKKKIDTRVINANWYQRPTKHSDDEGHTTFSTHSKLQLHVPRASTVNDPPLQKLQRDNLLTSRTYMIGENKKIGTNCFTEKNCSGSNSDEEDIFTLKSARDHGHASKNYNRSILSQSTNGNFCSEKYFKTYSTMQFHNANTDSNQTNKTQNRLLAKYSSDKFDIPKALSSTKSYSSSTENYISKETHDSTQKKKALTEVPEEADIEWNLLNLKKEYSSLSEKAKFPSSLARLLSSSKHGINQKNPSDRLYPRKESNELIAAACILRKRYKQIHFPLIPHKADASHSLSLETALKMLKGLSKLPSQEIYNFHSRYCTQHEVLYQDFIKFHNECIAAQSCLSLSQHRLLKEAENENCYQMNTNYLTKVREAIDHEILIYSRLGKRLAEIEQMHALQNQIYESYQQAKKMEQNSIYMDTRKASADSKSDMGTMNTEWRRKRIDSNSLEFKSANESMAMSPPHDDCLLNNKPIPPPIPMNLDSDEKEFETAPPMSKAGKKYSSSESKWKR